MRFRTYKNTDLRVSEVGFGLWTISTGWWGQFTEGEAIALMHKAFDLGITLFDAADTYGNGLSEELIAKAFPTQRDQIVIATKVGYDFVHYGEARGRGQREIPQDFSPEAVTRATDAALKRLRTDHVDLLQLHNIRMEHVYEEALWKTLEQLKRAGKARRQNPRRRRFSADRSSQPSAAQLAAQRNQKSRATPFSRKFRPHAGTSGAAMVTRGRSCRVNVAKHLQRRATGRVRHSVGMPAA